MIGTCRNCGNYQWDKKISEDGKQVVCPRCNSHWNYKSLPLFILTGCSGVGKTTTAQELQLRETKYIVMDADIFTFLGEDYSARAEQLLHFSKNIMQGGMPLMWTMAGALEKLNEAYNGRFFHQIYFLCLICRDEDLVDRMKNGRGISDERWIEGSLNHNKYLREHDEIDEIPYEKFDITGKNVEEVADYVNDWICSKLELNEV